MIVLNNNNNDKNNYQNQCFNVLTKLNTTFAQDLDSMFWEFYPFINLFELQPTRENEDKKLDW